MSPHKRDQKVAEFSALVAVISLDPNTHQEDGRIEAWLSNKAVKEANVLFGVAGERSGLNERVLPHEDDVGSDVDYYARLCSPYYKIRLKMKRNLTGRMSATIVQMTAQPDPSIIAN